MYQDQHDMIEEEYLRQRIRNILQEQVANRGYGTSWNSTLGAREPIRNEATIYQKRPLTEGYDESDYGGVMVGGSLNQFTLAQLKAGVKRYNVGKKGKQRILTSRYKNKSGLIAAMKRKRITDKFIRGQPMRKRAPVKKTRNKTEWNKCQTRWGRKNAPSHYNKKLKKCDKIEIKNDVADLVIDQLPVEIPEIVKEEIKENLPLIKQPFELERYEYKKLLNFLIDSLNNYMEKTYPENVPNYLIDFYKSLVNYYSKIKKDVFNYYSDIEASFKETELEENELEDEFQKYLASGFGGVSVGGALSNFTMAQLKAGVKRYNVGKKGKQRIYSSKYKNKAGLVAAMKRKRITDRFIKGQPSRKRNPVTKCRYNVPTKRCVKVRGKGYMQAGYYDDSTSDEYEGGYYLR